MSKHNYSQYSNQNKIHDDIVEDPIDVVIPEAEIEPEITVTPAIVTEEPAVTEPAAQPEVMTATGRVANCAKLNVRVKPDATADVVCVLDAASEIEINVDKSTNEWFSICTATGVEGYCMRKFVAADL